MKKDQRLHHEPDPRVRRSLVVALASSALLVTGALTAVGVRVEVPEEGGVARGPAECGQHPVEVGVVPVLLGGGIPLLPAPAGQCSLTLTGSRVYGTGIVSLEYAVRTGAAPAAGRRASARRSATGGSRPDHLQGCDRHPDDQDLRLASHTPPPFLGGHARETSPVGHRGWSPMFGGRAPSLSRREPRRAGSGFRAW